MGEHKDIRYVIGFVLQLLEVLFTGWMACMCAVHSFFLFVGRCCLGQDECYFARSFGISFCLLMFWISLVC